MNPHDLSQTPIAVVGIGCRMPGADNAEQYWRMIREGRHAIGELPPERLDRRYYVTDEVGTPGKSYTTLGGIVPARPINRDLCPITDELLENADIAHQNICEVASAALVDAGMNPANVGQKNTGVFIGHSGGSCLAGDITFRTYADMAAKLLRDSGAIDGLTPDQQQHAIADLVRRVRSEIAGEGQEGLRIEASNAASLISRVHGFEGPFAVTDAACASSLMALGMAVQALQCGRIDMALAGGASYSKWVALVLFSMAQSISATGSRPFDANADGLISSDGYGIVVLKTLAKALEDGDPIQAVIRGVGISSDGRGKSLWAPQASGQRLAVQRAYSGDVTPESLQYIECHATSTQVGDATELKGLAAAFEGQITPGRRIPIGSVKGNIGHTLEAAGIAGMLKAILAMKHGMIPPQAQFETPNPEVPWSDIPFQVATQPMAWDKPAGGMPRRTAVNSFGIGGLNVHLVMDDGLLPGEEAAIRRQAPAAITTSGDPARAGRNGQRFEPIAIVGSSTILPGALTQAAYWQLLQSGADPKQELPPGRVWDVQAFREGLAGIDVKTSRGGYITDFDYDWKRHKVPPKQVAKANPLQFMLLDAADQALADAGYEVDKLDRSKAAVVVGTVFGGDFAFQLQLGLRLPHMQDILRDAMRADGIAEADIDASMKTFADSVLEKMPALMDETGSFTSSTLASRLSKSFDFKGGAFAMDSDETSSLHAVNVGVGMLQTGTSDVVLCAAGQQWMDVTLFRTLENSGNMSDGQARSVLDAGYDGVLPAEGVAVVLMKRLADAERDGDRIRGIISGNGEIVFPGRPADASEAALRAALQTASTDPSDVGVLEVAGVAVPPDAVGSLAKAFEGSREQPVHVSDTAGQIGHIKGTSGMVALVKSLLEFENKTLPGTFGVDLPREAIAGNDAATVATRSQPLTASRDDGKAVVSINQFSPDGSGLSLTLESPTTLPKLAATPSHQPAQQAQPATASSKTKPAVLRMAKVQFGAPTVAALVEKLDAYASDDSLSLKRFSESAFRPDALTRIGWVADDASHQAKLVEAVTLLRGGGKLQRSARESLFIGRLTTHQQPMLAAICPGQGVAYPGMVDKIVDAVPAVKRRLDGINRTLADEGCEPFESLSQRADILSSQLTTLVANCLYQTAFEQLGVRPDYVCGHSYGEYAALIAAGVWDLRDAIQITKARAAAVEMFGGAGGGLTSVSASRDVVDAQIAAAGCELHIANINSPTQIVVGGSLDCLDSFERHLSGERVAFKRLAVPAAYHTPLMQPAVVEFADALSRVTLRPPKIAFITSVGNEQVSDVEVIRQRLAEQLVCPMDYVGLVDTLFDRGVRTCLDVGPKQVLARLTALIAGDRDLICLPLDGRDRDVAETAMRLQVAFGVRGHLDSSHAPPPAAVPATAATPMATSARPSSPSASTGRAVSSHRPAAASSTPVPSAPPRRSPMSTAADSPHATDQHATDQIVYFDATAPRKAANRERAIAQRAGQNGTPAPASSNGSSASNGLAPKPVSPQTPTSPAEHVRPQPVAAAPASTGSHTPTGHQQVSKQAALQFAAAANGQTATASAAALVEAPPKPRVVPDRSELQAFAIEYIVDQTGYPEEMVELDADLEADLGIDSIKKAQMLGEMAQKFELHWLADEVTDLSLDQFPTLESIVGFLTDDSLGGSDDSPATVAAPAAAPPAPQPIAAVTSEPVASAPPAPTSRGPLPDRSELQAFAIEYIVDQTGYPEEMVELDADLEADLGIDSIKKAQMLGEMAQKFELHWLADEVTDLSLDQFPTLESIVGFLTTDRVSADSTSALGPTLTEPPSTPAAIENRLGATEAPVAASPVEPESPAVPASRGPLPDRGELQAFAIEYIVDQTGYPEEMVELDADLEADLGIDSIKKAQMLGEMAQKFELHWLADEVTDLSLDQFPTLESIVGFLTTDRVVAAPAAAANAAPVAAPSAVPAAAPKPAPADPKLITVVECGGSPYELGKAHGLSQREAIQTILTRQIERYGDRLNNMPELDEALADPTRYFGEDEIAELRGIAEGAELPLDFLVSHNLGLCEDYVPGCVQFAVSTGGNRGQTLVHAANEDSSLALSLGDVLKRVVQYRDPENGYRHVVFGIAGQLAGLNGFNEKGLAATSTLLLDRTPRDVTARGQIHTVVVKRILESAATIEEAIEVLKSCQRSGAWSLCLSDHKSDRLCYVEYDAGEMKVSEPGAELVGSNHAMLLDPTAETPAHSVHRLKRLQELLHDDATAEGITDAVAEALLRDQYDYGRGRTTAHPTMNTVRRVDNQISVVMRPAEGTVSLTPGPMNPDVADEFETLDVSAFFTDGTAGVLAPQPSPVSTSGPSTEPRSAEPAAASITTPTAAADPFAGLPPVMSRVMRRTILRPRPADAAATQAWAPAGSVLVYGDGPVAEATASQLRSRGLSVETMPVTLDDAARQSAFADVSGMLTDVLIIGDESDSPGATDRFVAAFQLAQQFTTKLAAENRLELASLTFVSFLGGDFGLGGVGAGRHGGAFSGLAKALRREIPKLTTRCIDLRADEQPARLATAILDELATDGRRCETASLRGQRFELAGIPVPAHVTSGKTPTAGSAWIITGGARGVTAVVARELATRFGVRLHLVGSSPEPTVDPAWLSYREEELKTLRRSIFVEARERGEKPPEAWSKVERAIEIQKTFNAMRQLGIDLTYHQCDVSSAESVASLVETIRAAGHPIEGVIHGAGIEAACKFEKKKQPLVAKTMAVKLDGASHLEAALKHDPVRFFVGFGSTSGRFGGLGQADYSAASDGLAKYGSGLARRWPSCRVVTFHWPPWDEVGMAARPESKLALEAGGVGFMPPMEGAAFVIEELCSDSDETEVLIVDKPDGMDLDETLPARDQWDAYADAQSRVDRTALLQTVTEVRPGDRLRAEAVLDPAANAFLYDHQHDGVPILPAVISLELLTEGVQTLTGSTSHEATYLEIVNGLRFHSDQPLAATVEIDRDGDSFAAVLTAPFVNSKGKLVGNRREIAKATFVAGTGRDVPAIAAPTGDAMPIRYADAPDGTGPLELGSVYTGPTLRGATDVTSQSGSFGGTIIAPDRSRLASPDDLDAWATCPATIDSCLIVVDRWAAATHGRFFLPHQIESIRVLAPITPGETYTLAGRVDAEDDAGLVTTFTLSDVAGQPVLAVEGYRVSRVKAAPTESASQPAAAEPASSPTAEPTTALQSAGDRDFLFPVESIESDEQSARVVMTIDPENEPLCAQHRYEDRPLLPGAAIVELFLQAADAFVPGGGQLRLRDFSINGSLIFHSAAAKRIAVVVERGEPGWTCRLVDAGSEANALASATVDREAAVDVGELPGYAQPPGDMSPMFYRDADAPLIHGRAMRCIKEIRFGRNEGWGILVPTAKQSLLSRGEQTPLLTHPGIVDGSFYVCCAEAWYNEGNRVELPKGFDQFVRLSDRVPQPGERWTVQFAFLGSDPGSSNYDIVVYDPDAKPAILIKRFYTVNKGIA